MGIQEKNVSVTAFDDMVGSLSLMHPFVCRITCTSKEFAEIGITQKVISLSEVSAPNTPRFTYLSERKRRPSCTDRFHFSLSLSSI